jgi:hypothetical protein
VYTWCVYYYGGVLLDPINVEPSGASG